MLQLTTIFFLIAGSTLAVLHVLALQFFLYWKFHWFDMPMHFLGGVVVGLLLYTMRDLGVSLIPAQPRWFVVLLFVLMFAVAWEIYEVLIGIEIMGDYVKDTLSDLILGALGGLAAYYVGNRMRIGVL